MWGEHLRLRMIDVTSALIVKELGTRAGRLHLGRCDNYIQAEDPSCQKLKLAHNLGQLLGTVLKENYS